MSWSSGRKPDVQQNAITKKTISDEHKLKLESIRQINGVLDMFARDEDLQDDLKLPNVRLALDHWTGTRRLPAEIYSKKLETDSRVNSVYPKLKLLQSICIQANMKVPLDHMLEAKRLLDPYTLTTSFGTDFCILHDLTRPLTPKNTPRGEKETSVISAPVKCAVSRKLADEIEIGDERTDNSQDVKSNSFSIWRIMVESCRSADWMEICSRTFRQQFYILIVTIFIAYFLGYISVDKLRIF